MEFKYCGSTFNFEEMIVLTPETGWWKLKFSHSAQELYRLGNDKFHRLAPVITEAYLDYKVEQILLENE